MKKYLFVKDIPFYVTVLMVIYTILFLLLNDKFIFSSKSIIGICSISVCSLIYLINKKIHEVLFATTLIVGVLGFLSLTHYNQTTTISFEFTNMNIGLVYTFSPFPLLLLLLLLISFILFRIKEIKKYREKRELKNSDIENSNKEISIDKWVKRFENKTDQELISMQDNIDNYNAEAQKAIEDLIYRIKIN